MLLRYSTPRTAPSAATEPRHRTHDLTADLAHRKNRIGAVPYERDARLTAFARPRAALHTYDGVAAPFT